jgi:hypothetical protein
MSVETNASVDVDTVASDGEAPALDAKQIPIQMSSNMKTSGC